MIERPGRYISSATIKGALPIFSVVDGGQNSEGLYLCFRNSSVAI